MTRGSIPVSFVRQKFIGQVDVLSGAGCPRLRGDMAGDWAVNASSRRRSAATSA